MPKTQRIRDPVHGLIVFDEKNEVDQLAWRLINTREFQRLRRIRQLGFSDLVYPGATHSRLAHSLGVYCVARRLIQIIQQKLGHRDLGRERITLIAALLHDIGHGPFSHAFEHAAKEAGRARSHEQWSADIIRGDTEVHEVLSEADQGLPGAIAAMLLAEETKDIYATVVSSQFDADRLDYLRRDRLMTGIGSAYVDSDWLLDCLETGKLTIGTTDPFEVDCLYLNPKGVHVAEEYLEARFRLYMMVYMHKTTRAAEMMLQEFLKRLAAVASGARSTDGHPRLPGCLAAYFASRTTSLREYLALDDTVVWAELSSFREAVDPMLRELAARLCDRKLYKCFDLGARIGDKQNDNLAQRFRKRLKDSGRAPNYLFDDASVTFYKWYDFGDPSALNKVLVKFHKDDKEPSDIGSRSDILKAMREKEMILRYYAPEEGDLGRLNEIWKESSQ
jgi:hypothetical protein